MTRADRSRLPEVGPDPAFAFPDIVHHTLANGLRVRVVPRRGAPVVTVVLQVEGGAGVDPPGCHGLAALVADMLDEGTGALSALEVSDALARLGADYDVDVSPDATTMTLTTLERFAERGASLLASIVVSPSFRPADFDRVRQLRLDRLGQIKDLPSAVAERAFLQLLYGDHPYGHLPLGSAAALERLALSDVQSFHRAVYRPSQATLVIGGPVDASQAVRMADAAFGGWREPVDVPADAGLAASVPPPDRPGPRLAVVVRDAAAQSELRIGHLSARRDTPDYFPLLVMNAVIGGQFVSRVNLKLREEKGYTYGARTGFDWRRGVGPFVLQTSVSSRNTADAVRDSLAELDGIRGSRPPSDEEIALARASLTRGYPRSFETVGQVVRAVAQLALFDLPDTYFQTFVPSVQAVTVADVVRAARQYVDPARLTTLIVGDYPAFRDSLAGLGLGEPQVLPVEA